MPALLEKECRYCGELFTTSIRKKVFCCDRHRRLYHIEKDREIRAENSLRYELYRDAPMVDVWEKNHLPPSITENALLDGWSGECDICPDEAIAGPMACQVKACPYKGKSMDLLCAMCRDGCLM